MQVLSPGMVAGFPAGSGDGHHLINRTDAEAVNLEVGNREKADAVNYPDGDLIRRVEDGHRVFLHGDGRPLLG